MSSEIAVQNQCDFQLDDTLTQQLKEAVLATLKAEGVDFDCEVSILFCENESIRELNAQYRNKDRETDVLSFPIYDSADELREDAKLNCLADYFCLGDVVIAPHVVLQAAEEIGDPFEKHLCRMCIHSVLHLLGYDHETSPEDEQAMLAKQEQILETLFEQ